MDWLRTFKYLLYFTLAILAWLVVRHDRRHAALAAYVTWMPIADLIRVAIRGSLDHAPRPLAGWPLLLRHLDVAMVLSWSFLFLAIALRYFTRLSPRLAFVAFGLTWVVCLLPGVRGQVILDLYRALSIVTMLAVWGCLARAIVQRDTEPQLAHLIILLYNAADVAAILVPFMRGYVENWGVSRVLTTVLLIVCCGAHVRWLLEPRAVGASRP